MGVQHTLSKTLAGLRRSHDLRLRTWIQLDACTSVPHALSLGRVGSNKSASDIIWIWSILMLANKCGLVCDEGSALPIGCGGSFNASGTVLFGQEFCQMWLKLGWLVRHTTYILAVYIHIWYILYGQNIFRFRNSAKLLIESFCPFRWALSNFWTSSGSCQPRGPDNMRMLRQRR